MGVVLDALDERARAAHVHHEFERLSDHPNRLLIAMTVIEKARKTRGALQRLFRPSFQHLLHLAHELVRQRAVDQPVVEA